MQTGIRSGPVCFCVLFEPVGDFLERQSEEEELTKSKFKEIRNCGTEDELLEALEKMEEMGGYENLPEQ